VRAALFSAVLATAVAAADEGGTEAVIPSGHDALLAEMLGRGAPLPGTCSFVSGAVQRTIIRTVYHCPSGEVVFELSHPEAAPPAALRTARFAIALRHGSPPGDLIEALAARIRSRESAFEWSRMPAAGESHPVWLLTLRLNIALFVVGVAAVLGWNLSPARLRTVWRAQAVLGTALALTALAAVLRFAVASTNLMDYGGIPYSRLLRGYKGYLGTAQVYSILYGFTARDIEHAILFNRIAGTLTIPLVYVLCRSLLRGATLWPATAAFLFAVYPLHILFSASDTLAVFSCFLAAGSYALLAGAVGLPAHPMVARLHYLAAFAGLALLTQVRYENALLLIPAALLLFARRNTLRARELVPPLIVPAAFAAIYAYGEATAGISHQNPVRFWWGVEIVTRHLVLNPFLAVPVLLVGTVAVWAYAGMRAGLLALLPWLSAFLLCSLALSDGHGAARIYANWLILILPIAAYGFASMLREARRSVMIVAAGALLWLTGLPLLVHDRLSARHLEILENDRFRTVLATLAPSVRSIIVPDDELLRRQFGATAEVFGKYAAILEGSRDAPRRTELVALTQYLEAPQRTPCEDGACVFFFGVPCMDQDAYPFAREQCQQLLRRHRTSLLDETTVVAAPFVRCSIYPAALREEFCDPATKPHRFATYRLED
jgi:hypothetical protein